MASQILVVEDEPAIAELAAINLRHAGYSVTIAENADRARRCIDAELPTLVILDWMLPGESGVQLAKAWRGAERTRELPIIMLTARAEESDKVIGLEAGADDYLTKPFSAKELIARIRAVLRRRAPHKLEETLRIGPLVLDPVAHRVTAQMDSSEADLKLGPTEFRLLRYLMSHPDRVHSRTQLLDRVWGDHVYIEERTVDVHIKRLRESLTAAGCSQMIETVRGAGYRLSRTAAASEARLV